MAGLTMYRLKFFLSGKIVTLAVIAIAIISRLIQLVYFYTIGFDASYQVIATHNFVTGHGVSLAKVLPADLSATIYEPLINWPPGYSVLLSPFYILFDHNYILSGLTLDILAAVTLIFVSRSILKLLEVPLHFINIYTLLTGFFIYHFYFIASSDAIAITAFMIALYYALSLLKTDQRWIKKTTGLIAGLFICGFIKYLFIPVVLIIPVFLFLRGRAVNSLPVKKAGMISFLFLVVTLGGLLLYQKYTTGSAAYISHPGRGFFPEHLLTAYPIFPGSVIKPETLALLLNQQPGITGFIYRFFQCLHILAFIFFAFYMVKNFSKNGFKTLSVKDAFFYLAFLVSLAITVLLAFLSARVPKEEIKPGMLWTYVQEPRYYGLINVLLQLGLFIIYSYYRRHPLKYLRYAFCFLLLLLLPELFRGIAFDTKRIVNSNKEKYFWVLEYRFQQYTEEIIKKAVQKQPVENVMVTGSSYYVNNRIAVYSHVPVLKEYEHINDFSSLHTTRPVLLLVILHETSLKNFQPFLSAQGKEVAGYSQGFYFYTVYVTPH